MSSRPLQDQVIVITGASSGFGKGAARRFARAGASLVLAARREALLEELARECEAMGARTLAVATDVSRREDVERLGKAAVSAFGRIDVWINDAGVCALGRFEAIPLADHVQVIETNLLGTIYGSYVALQQFRRQKHGTLINMASVVGKIPVPYYASYSASKAAVVALSASLRQEIRQNRDTDVHVCTVMPTTFDTPFFDHVANYTGHETQPIPPVYDPEAVVEVLYRLALEPQDEVMVGAAAKVSEVAHQVAPETTEKLWGKRVHKVQIEDAPRAEAQKGAVHEPVDIGTEVRAGRMNKPIARAS